MDTAAKKEISRNAFMSTVPEFTFSVNGEQIMIMIKQIAGASGYEVCRSRTEKGKYEFVAGSASPVLDCYIPEGSSCYYKVRAFRGKNDERIVTHYSAPSLINLVEAGKKRNEKIDSFFEAIKDLGEVLSFDDLDVAIEALKVAGLETIEREERRRLEEDRRKMKRDMEKQEKQRMAAARRAALRRERIRLDPVIEQINLMEVPSDFENTYKDDERAAVRCDTIADGLMMSLDRLGAVDIEYISSVTGEEMKAVIGELKGVIYQNPMYWDEVFYKGWETADEYLSGNIMRKYTIAKEANEKYRGYFQNNVTALEGILGEDVRAEEIYVTLGSPWVPSDVIDDFIEFLAFDGKKDSVAAKEYYKACDEADYAVRHDTYTGNWEIPEITRFRKGRFHGMFEEVNYRTYGTNRMDMMTILENTLNMKTLSVYDPKEPGNPKCKVRVINQEETLRVLEKQRLMTDLFRKWVWKDENRKKRLQQAYCRKYANTRRRVFDGSFLELKGMSDEIKLYDYQKNAVARILFSPNTLLAHSVGSGKTYVMIAAGMELRRLGRSKKNLYVVPNNIIGQWESLFLKMYPDARILVVNKSNFNPKKRAETLVKIKNEDYDAIIMTHSCFDMLTPSDRYYINLYSERLKLLKNAGSNLKAQFNIEKKREGIREAIAKLQKTYKRKPKLIPFDELGINTLFVDEAHVYKNITIESRITRVRGGSRTGSKHCNDMLDKVHCVQRMNHGGRVIFATGTPVTNSLTDLYAMQRYLQEGELEFQGVLNFDAWAGMYAEKTTDFEIDLDTKSYHLVTRFARFCNLPELTATLSSITDYHETEKAVGLPVLDGYTDSVSRGSEAFRDYLREISNRADDIRRKRVSAREDNMLKVTTDGRKAALDMRLVDTAFGLEPEAKVLRCAENVAEVYMQTRDSRGTQLVFCDISTPKEGFNLYDDLKKLLTAMGIPENEIAFIHDARTDLQRKTLFRLMQEGKLAVLIGSTEKMGHGMNVQKHLAALHHLDVPWRPSDMVQREGRILRQGNENEKVRIFRYVTMASFDAYSWQLLETKQRFIGQIMSGETAMREGSDIDDTVLNYAEVKALAVGNSKIKRRVVLCNELDRYRILQRDFVEERRKKQQTLMLLPEKIEAQKTKIRNCGLDISVYEKEKTDVKMMDIEEKDRIRNQIWRAVVENSNSDRDTEVMTYHGFRVIVPAYMMPKQAERRRDAEHSGEQTGEEAAKRKVTYYVHLKGNGTYYMEIEKEAGILTRLNNLLERLPVQKERYEEILQSLEYQKGILEEETKEDTAGGYADTIASLEKEIDQLNRELGIAA